QTPEASQLPVEGLDRARPSDPVPAREGGRLPGLHLRAAVPERGCKARSARGRGLGDRVRRRAVLRGRMMIYIGIDPGASGGMAWIAPLDNATCSDKMPSTERDVWEWFRGWTVRKKIIAVIEKVG